MKLIWVLLSLVLIGATSAFSAPAIPEEAIGRLEVDKRFICTYFVVESWSWHAVSLNFLVSAGHCGGEEYFAVDINGNRSPVTVFAVIETIPDGLDLLLGYFLSPGSTTPLPTALEEKLSPGALLLVVGYPNGKRSSVTAKFIGRQNSNLVLDGIFPPGFSGGPVINIPTGEVAGMLSGSRKPCRPEEDCPRVSPGYARPIEEIMSFYQTLVARPIQSLPAPASRK